MNRHFMFQAVMVVVILTIVAIASVAQGAESKPLKIVKTDFNSEITSTYIEVHSRYAWDVIASTEGWGELDGGLNFVRNGWFIQPLVGLDFFQADGRTKAGRAYGQLFAIRFSRELHSEFHFIGGIPMNRDVQENFSSRALTTYRLPGTSFFQGLQLDAKTYKGLRPTFWIGPMVELDRGPIRLSFTLQTEGNATGTPRSRFILTGLVTL